ncbi:MAG: hypothetical protein OXC57_02215 [Rhodobacteraceae bacterium]|nr:hypothetical protein [Paracoccaceae bacterium]
MVSNAKTRRSAITRTRPECAVQVAVGIADHGCGGGRYRRNRPANGIGGLALPCTGIRAFQPRGGDGLHPGWSGEHHGQQGDGQAKSGGGYSTVVSCVRSPSGCLLLPFHARHTARESGQIKEKT